MRNLKTADLFSFARLIKASGIREELVQLFQNINADSDKERVGMTTILMVIEALSKAECEVYEALAPVFEMKASEIQDLPPKEFFSLLKKMSQDNDLESFFGSVFGTLGNN